MESGEDTVRVKEESKYTWPDASDDYTFDSVDSYETKNFEAFKFDKSSVNTTNEPMHLQEKLDEKIFIDFECKDVKPEPMLSTTVCKTEYQSCLPIVKVENKIQNNDLNEENQVFLIPNLFDYNDSQFQLNSPMKLEEYEVEKLSKTSQTKRCYKCKTCRKTFKKELNLKEHIYAAHKGIDPYRCKICHKSFVYQSYIKRHVNIVHNKSKPFECEICRKSFGYKSYLRIHINAVHYRSKPFECEICHKSFGEKGTLKNHLNTIHNRSKPFECEICHKSFGYKNNLNKHVNAVHNRSKPFECGICRKAFGYRSVLKTHICRT